MRAIPRISGAESMELDWSLPKSKVLPLVVAVRLEESEISQPLAARLWVHIVDVSAFESDLV